jgi:hypothetical protein
MVMDESQARRDQISAYIREADARLDYLEAQARVQDAREEMREIVNLRERRERWQQKLSDAGRSGREAWDELRRGVESEWQDFRRAIDDVNRRYSMWDAARERRFNARLDEAQALLRQSTARDAEVFAAARGSMGSAAQDLRRKTDDARAAYDAWRDRRTDERLQQRLSDAELELVVAYERIVAANRELDRQRAGREGGSFSNP